MPRLTLTDVAEILDVSPRTVQRYRTNTYSPASGRTPVFPDGKIGADGDRTWTRTEITTWNKTRQGATAEKAPGGRPKGKPAAGKACENPKCGTVVPRRKWNEKTERYECLPCYKQRPRKAVA